MKILIKKAKIVNPHSAHHGRTVDIFINKGKIESVKSSIAEIAGAKLIVSKNLHCSAAWLDIGTQIGEPGLEHREDIQSIAKAAKAGGYSTIAPFPNSVSPVQSKAAIKFIIDLAKANNFNILPIAAMSVDCAGQDISEMIDLSRSGAIAFSDGLKSAGNSGILYRALEYAKSFDGLIVQHSVDKHLAFEGQMHEGLTSTSLGVKGIPGIAETIALRRDIDLLQYTKSKLCLFGISSAEALKIIRESKRSSENLFATVAYLNLIKTDVDLTTFDSNLKVTPPLRGKKDRQDLVKAINDDTIDAIVSNHYPLDEEAKKLEFTYAHFGASGIETCFAALNTFCGHEIHLEKIVEKLSAGPRKILNISNPTFTVGDDADMTLFDPDYEWKFEKTLSKSLNNPFLGTSFKGKALMTI